MRNLWKRVGIPRRLLRVAALLTLMLPPLASGATAPAVPHPSNPPSIINHGPRTKHRVALTFDADMTPAMLEQLRSGKVRRWFDPRIIATLESTVTPATIFVAGLWAETYPDVIRELGRNPLFEIENHSFSHGAFRRPCYHLATVKDKREEIAETQHILRGLTGQIPRFFRFPGGCYSSGDVRLVQGLGLQVIGWDVVSGDAFMTHEKAIVERVLKNVLNGSIIVMHLVDGPNAPETARALPQIIRGLRERGFAFVTLRQLLGR